MRAPGFPLSDRYELDSLRVETEVLDVRVSESKPDRGIVTVRNQTLNQRGEPVQVAVVKMLVPRRPSGLAAAIHCAALSTRHSPLIESSS